MKERLLLDKIDYKQGTIKLGGKEYPLNDTYFPTIDPKDPYKLTQEEEDVVERLKTAFSAVSVCSVISGSCIQKEASIKYIMETCCIMDACR